MSRQALPDTSPEADRGLRRALGVRHHLKEREKRRKPRLRYVRNCHELRITTLEYRHVSSHKSLPARSALASHLLRYNTEGSRLATMGNIAGAARGCSSPAE